MDMPVYEAVQDAQSGIESAIGAKFDPSLYTEHQAVNLNVNSSSLTTLMSATGKGMLEEVLIVPINTALTSSPEIKIVVDGITILDLVGNHILGIMPSNDFIVTAGQSGSYEYVFTSIKGLENTIGYVIINWEDSNILQPFSRKTFSYPSTEQQNISDEFASVISLDQPIYFNYSFTIQCKGVTTNGCIRAVAKARY